MPYLPYEQPGITTILSLTSFLILLNGIRYVLDKLLYCGLLGEIFIGVIWGLPVGGTALLTKGTQEAIQSFGYLGLVGLVFQGGLSLSLSQLRKTVLLSVSVAAIGLILPIALSFLLILLPFESGAGTAFPSPLAAFSAGASLCSTSLGTTFAILSSVNMQKSRTGVVLVGASMLDDVVGLVMVNIVATLGHGASGPWPIARPITAGFGLLIATCGLTSFVIKPAWTSILACLQASGPVVDTDVANEANKASTSKRFGWTQAIVIARRVPHLAFILSMVVLLVFITIASFIDTSVLFAAFLAGAVVNYLWSIAENKTTGNGNVAMYDQYYRPLLDYALVPFFFASIGFAIPISSMFVGPIIWRGLLYGIVMTVAKASVCVVIYCDYYIRRWWRKELLGPESSQEDIRNLRGAPHSQALIVAFAMVARGEIGFLIASLSQSSGTLILQQNGVNVDSSTGEDIFLVILWAVMLCTAISPVMVGIIARRYARGPTLAAEGTFELW